MLMDRVKRVGGVFSRRPALQVRPASWLASVLVCLGALGCGLEGAEAQPVATDQSELGLAQWSAQTLPLVPTAMSPSGTIVGNDPTWTIAYQYQQGGVRTTLATYPSASATAEYIVRNISSSGVVLGSISDSFYLNGVLWPNTGSISLMNAAYSGPGLYTPTAITASRQVVGYLYQPAAPYLTALTWTPAGYYVPLPPPVVGSSSRATDVNDLGAVVGVAVGVKAAQVVLWSTAGVPTSLAALPRADASNFNNQPHIRNSGEVVWESAGQVFRYAGGVASPAVTPVGTNHLTAFSQAGRIGGVVTFKGVTRGWSSMGATFTYHDVPGGASGDSFEPRGIDSCGDVVGVVHHSGGKPDTGLGFFRTYFGYCDTPPVFSP